MSVQKLRRLRNAAAPRVRPEANSRYIAALCRLAPRLLELWEAADKPAAGEGWMERIIEARNALNLEAYEVLK